MTRARTDIATVDANMRAAFKTLREMLPHLEEDGPQDAALTEIETFVAIALRVMAKTNPSKIRSEAMNVELQFRLPA
jgi:hypothetical protein